MLVGPYFEKLDWEYLKKRKLYRPSKAESPKIPFELAVNVLVKKDSPPGKHPLVRAPNTPPFAFVAISIPYDI